MLSAAFLTLIMRLTVLGQQGSGEEQTQQEYPTKTLWNSQCFTAHNNIPAMTNQGLQFKSASRASWISCFFRFLLAHYKRAGCIVCCQGSSALMIPSPAEQLCCPTPHQTMHTETRIAVQQLTMVESASTITYQKTLQPLFCVCPELSLEAEATQVEQPTAL